MPSNWRHEVRGLTDKWRSEATQLREASAHHSIVKPALATACSAQASAFDRLADELEAELRKLAEHENHSEKVIDMVPISEIMVVGYLVRYGALKWLSKARSKVPWIKQEELVTKASAEAYASAQVEQSLDIRMHGMNITDGKIALELGTDMAKIMAEAYLGMLDTMGAVNYCELEMHVGDGRKLLVTVQRLEKPTAHDLRLAAEAKFNALLLQVAAGQGGSA